MQNRKEIVMINVANIYPHPDNPRKDVGDVTELQNRIKKQGVMQGDRNSSVGLDRRTGGTAGR